MKRLSHIALVSMALIMLIISISGYMGVKQTKDQAETDQLSLVEFNRIITEEQHSYQLEEQKQPNIPWPKYSTLKYIDEYPRKTGLIVWEDPDGVEFETTYSLEGTIVRFGDDDLVRDEDRMRFKDSILREVNRGVPE